MTGRNFDQSASQKKVGLMQWFPQILFIGSCVFLLIIFGFSIAFFEVFPFKILNFGFKSVEKVYNDWEIITQTRPKAFLWAARYEGTGVVRYNQEESAPGLTLLSSFFDGGTELRLIEASGKTVAKWPVRYLDIWPDPQHKNPENLRPKTNWGADIHGALALSDGSVVFNFEYGGMVKMSQCGDIQWTVPLMTHHSLERAEGGGFFVPGRRYVSKKSEFPPVKAPYHEDTILKISDEGEVLKEISVPWLFYKNNLQALWLANGQGDVKVPNLELVHLNDVEELTSRMASQFPSFERGDLVLSLRALNLLMVVNPETYALKWHMTGPWLRQHDPDFQANGTITVFNNNTDNSQDGRFLGGSNIMEVNPETKDVSVLFGNETKQMMFSGIRGKHQILENGNILITESTAGRVIEVTPTDDIVWEFINRFDEKNVVTITQAIRYPSDYFQVENWSCN